MSVAIVTGSAGLVGSESVRFLAEKGFEVVGIDNDMRAEFFGEQASTAHQRGLLLDTVSRYRHRHFDIRNETAMNAIFGFYKSDIALIVHAAAQPSHDWAAFDPKTDFEVNALGTLNILEAARKFCPNATFIFCSTNKVYGDTPNALPLVEQETRFELTAPHAFANHGIDESMSIDGTRHSLFGVSKTSADLMVQEYGRYFGMNTVCFRGGCLTGPDHAGAPLHGFLAYLIQCAVTGTEYKILGYKGKQVRDNIHVSDLIAAFWAFHESPRSGAVYNIGGGRFSNCSIMEAITMAEELTGKPMVTSYVDTPRIGDHVWYISDVRKFRWDYPDWRPMIALETTIQEIYLAAYGRHRRSA